jgi:hypothetical protein
MLRPKKFSRSETVILCLLGALLLAAGAIGIYLAVEHVHWILALASAGILGLAALYFLAARRGRPL